MATANVKLVAKVDVDRLLDDALELADVTGVSIEAAVGTMPLANYIDVEVVPLSANERTG